MEDAQRAGESGGNTDNCWQTLRNESYTYYLREKPLPTAGRIVTPRPVGSVRSSSALLAPVLQARESGRAAGPTDLRPWPQACPSLAILTGTGSPAVPAQRPGQRATRGSTASGSRSPLPGTSSHSRTCSQAPKAPT